MWVRDRHSPGGSAASTVLVSSNHSTLKGKKFPLISRQLDPACCVYVCLHPRRVCLPSNRLVYVVMIVVEEPHVRKTQFYAQFDVPVATSSTPLIPTESPPAYTPRQDPGPSSSSAPPYHDPPPPPATQKQQPKPAATRFFEALLLALGTYAAIAFVVQMLMHMFERPWDDVR